MLNRPIYCPHCGETNPAYTTANKHYFEVWEAIHIKSRLHRWWWRIRKV